MVHYSYDYYLNAIHVKEDAGGKRDGTSWTDAYTDLQEALDKALDVLNTSSATEVDVFVARGPYRPVRSHGLQGSARTFNFRMYNGINIRGSFCGTSAYLQNIEAHPSIISGDLGKFKTFHVLYFSSDMGLDLTAYMEDMVIEGADAAGMLNSGSQSFGGGLYAEEGNEPLFVNCIFRNNRAVSGGGACFMAVDAENHSTKYYPVMYQCLFENNRATRSGGGLSIHNSRIDLTGILLNTVFRDNEAKYGGGMSLIKCRTQEQFGTSSDPGWEYPLIIFENNKSTRGGGGLYLHDPVETFIYRTLFADNRSEEYGGGLMISGGKADFRNNVFYKNGATIGGAVYLIAGRYKFRSLMFVKNSASQTAGALFTASVRTILDRCYFRENKTTGLSYPEQKGGGITANRGLLGITNTIFIKNNSLKGGCVYGLRTDIRASGNTYLCNNADAGSVIYNDKGLLALYSSIIRKPEGSSENRPIFGSMSVSYMTADPGTLFDDADNITYTDPGFEITSGSVPYLPDEECDLFFPAGLTLLGRGSNTTLNGNLFDFIGIPRPVIILNGYLEDMFTFFCVLADEEDFILTDEEDDLLEDICPEDDYDYDYTEILPEFYTEEEEEEFL